MPLLWDALDQRAGDKAVEMDVESARRNTLPWSGSDRKTDLERALATLEI
jgi:hypothetical protein